MPFDTTTSHGFVANILLEWVIIENAVMVPIAFMAFYVGVCTYFQPCLDDLRAILMDARDDVSERISIKQQLVQFIELHQQMFR